MFRQALWISRSCNLKIVSPHQVFIWGKWCSVSIKIQPAVPIPSLGPDECPNDQRMNHELQDWTNILASFLDLLGCYLMKTGLRLKITLFTRHENLGFKTSWYGFESWTVQFVEIQSLWFMELHLEFFNTKSCHRV